MKFTRLSIALALVFAVAGCATTTEPVGKIDPTIASYIDSNSTVPMRAGTYVTHYAKKIHYDGAKDEDTISEIHGIGPATSTPADRKP